MVPVVCHILEESSLSIHLYDNVGSHIVILSGEEVTLHICRFETIVSYTVKMDTEFW